MSFFDKLRKGGPTKPPESQDASPEALAAAAKLLGIEPPKFQTLSTLAQSAGTATTSGKCDKCGGSFIWLETLQFIPARLSPGKPGKSRLDVGGWCRSCQRLLCADEADFVTFSFKGEELWVAGCSQCQTPFLGYRGRPDLKGSH